MKTARGLSLWSPLALAFAVVCALSGASLAGRSRPLSVEIDRVGKRVWVARAAIGTNVTAVSSSRGVVIVDTHLAPSVMGAIKEKLSSEIGRRDFAYVVNTHAHWDHCSGNQVFADATIVGHENAPVFMRYHPANAPGTVWYQSAQLSRERAKLEAASTPAEKETMGATVAAREAILDDLASTYRITPPTVTFEGRRAIDLGDVTLEMMSCGDPHSITDIFVYVPEERVVMTGDVFCSRTSLCFDVSPLVDVPALLGAVDYVLERGVDVVVPGHGELMTADDLRALRKRLAEEYAAVKDSRSAARFLERTLEETTPVRGLRSFRAIASDTVTVGYYKQEEFYIVANRMVDRGQPDTAIGVFALASELFPESALILNGLANAYWIAGDTTSAIAAFDGAYALDRDNRYAEEMLKLLRGDR